MTWNEVVKQGYDQFMKRNEDLEYVVRCKDCKHYIKHDHRCGKLNHGVKTDFYCGFGERKETEDAI